jgi:hypothetical protein
MTVSSTTSKASYTGNGLTTSFAVPFYFLAAADLQVILRSGTTETVQALTTNYTVSGAGNEAGGTVTMLVAPASGTTLTIRRSIAATQGTDLLPNDRLPAEDLEDGLDKLTMIAQQLGEESDRSIKFPASDAAVSAQVPAASARASKFLSFDSNGLPVATVGVDATTDIFTQSGAGAVSRSVNDKLRDVVSVKDFGAVGDGLTNDTAALQTAINTGLHLLFPPGTYRAANLSQTANFQRFYADGDVKIQKNANGPIITSSGNDVEFNGIDFRGESSSPAFTGDNIVSNGNNFRLINCGSRWAYARAVKATGAHLQIIGTCDLYQTTDATSNGYDIEIGVSGTATLYHQLQNIYSSQSTGGILATDTGSLIVVGSQFGKLTIAAGTSPAGINGGMYSSNRITGSISVSVSNSVFSGNQLGGTSITFQAGTSGHLFVGNSVQVGTTLTDSSTSSIVVDPREAVQTNYTPTWTAASVDPTLGNGTLQGVYIKTGKRVDVQLYLVIGSTTTLGTGVWYFSLPFIPSTGLAWIGSGLAFISGTAFYVVAAQSMTDSSGRMILTADGAGNQVSPTSPGAWPSNSYLAVSLSYYTQA